MADEIQIVNQVSCRNGTFILPTFGTERLQFDQEGIGGGSPGYVNVDTTPLLVDFESLDMPGYVWMKNVDEVQTVQIGFSEGSGDITWGPCMPPRYPASFMIIPGMELWLRVDPDSEESGSSSEENMARVQVIVLER